MAVTVYRKTVTIPANTPQSANFVQDISFPASKVERIVIRVPPGPRGEVGIALGSGGLRAIPDREGGFIVADNEVIDWPLEDLWDTGSWQVFGYNTGFYAHTLEIRFLTAPAQQETFIAAPLALTGTTVH